MFTAREMMTVDVVSVQPSTSIKEAVEIFERHRVSGLPVVNSQKHLLGVITEYDLLRSISTLQMRGTVADFMTEDLVTVRPEATLVELADLFISEQIRRVPVVSGAELIGVISRRDLIFAGNIRQQLTDLPFVSEVPQPV